VSKSTVNRELDLLKSLFARAVEWGYLRVNPTRRVKKYSLETEEQKFLSPAEGAQLVAACNGQYKTFVTLGLNSGLRRGEMFALRWEDLDFEKREVHVRRSKGKRFRVVPMNRELYDALRKHPRHIKSRYVFHRSDGSPWADVRTAFRLALERCGMEGLRVHDLRHSFISNLVAAGVDLRQVQELAGHRDIRTTMKYAHLRPNQLRDSVEKLRWG